MIKVSIITVCYNSALTIKDTIESVVNQSYPNIEYIVVDGLSKDNTVEIVKSYGNKITRFVSEKDKGIYDGLNKGIAMASGDIVGLIHADDFYANNNVIEEIVNQFNKTGAEAVYSDLDYVQPDDTTKILRHWVSGNYKKGMFLYGWMPPHPSFFVKRSLYEKFGVFNLELKSAADYELMLRFIHKQEIKLSYLPKVTVKMRAGGMSNKNFKNRFKANIEDRKAWEINDVKPYFFTLFLKPIRKIGQYLFKK